MQHSITDNSYEHFMNAARARLDRLTKPQGSLGRLEDIAALICAIQRTNTPRAANAHTLIFAGNHGVVARGVSAFPAEVTVQMVANFEAGGAAINQLCSAIPSTLAVIPIQLENPTQDFTKMPAMSEAQCNEVFAIGANAVPSDADILVLGEMGIGNTTSAAAIAHFLAGGDVQDWVGRGTGVSDEALKRKCDAVREAVERHRAYIKNPMQLLACLGGYELAAMAGAITRARELHIPVLLDGYVVTAAASALTLSDKTALAHCIAGHMSVEPGHKKLLAHMGLSPLFDLQMRLGEGSGAQIALAIVRAALATFNGMATFDAAGVSDKHDVT